MPHVGQRMYVVRWKDGEPYIVGGKVIAVGRKASPSRVKLDNDEGTVPTKDADETICEALRRELLDVAGLALRSSVFKTSLSPWDMARCVARLTRLRRKLERHGLWRL